MTDLSKLVRYDTLESLKANLQAKLGRAEPEREPALDFRWLRTAETWRSLLTEVGLEVVLQLRDGRVFVGTLTGLGGCVALALWGCAGAVTRFAFDDVAGATIVGPHGFREEREVRRRQRRGEPALVTQRPPKTRKGSP